MSRGMWQDSRGISTSPPTSTTASGCSCEATPVPMTQVCSSPGPSAYVLNPTPLHLIPYLVDGLVSGGRGGGILAPSKEVPGNHHTQGF